MRRILFLTILLILYSQAVCLAAPKLLFDQGHGQAFTIEKQGMLQLGSFADRFRADGWQVSSSTAEISPGSLAGVDALVISGAFKPFSSSEIKAVAEYLRKGGRVAIMLHIAQPYLALLKELGVVTANGVVREGRESLFIGPEPLNFRVVKLEEHPLTRGLRQFSLYGGWPLLPEGANTRSIASTSPTAWVDLDGDKMISLNDAIQELSVIVTGSLGQGEFVVFADDAIFQNRFLKDENIDLADNLSRWLKRGGGTGSTEI